MRRASWVVSDNQVRRLRELMAKDNRVIVNAAKVDMDTKTARKYLREDVLQRVGGRSYLED